MANKNDPYRFRGSGVEFNGKLIGVTEVSEPRGDKMCHEAMQRLKNGVKAAGQHKQRISINVCLDGIKLKDFRNGSIIHQHAVHKISFIARDTTDTRAFGFVYCVSDGKYEFYAIKTEKASEGLVMTLKDLFQVVYELKKREVEQVKENQDTTNKNTDSTEVKSVTLDGTPENTESSTDTQDQPENKDEVDKTPKKPEKTEQKCLLDLEFELESIQQGMSTLGDVKGEVATPDGWGTGQPWGGAPPPPARRISQPDFTAAAQSPAQRPEFAANFDSAFSSNQQMSPVSPQTMFPSNNLSVPNNNLSIPNNMATNQTLPFASPQQPTNQIPLNSSPNQFGAQQISGPSTPTPGSQPVGAAVSPQTGMGGGSAGVNTQPGAGVQNAFGAGFPAAQFPGSQATQPDPFIVSSQPGTPYPSNNTTSPFSNNSLANSNNLFNSNGQFPVGNSFTGNTGSFPSNGVNSNSNPFATAQQQPNAMAAPSAAPPNAAWQTGAMLMPQTGAPSQPPAAPTDAFSSLGVAASSTARSDFFKGPQKPSLSELSGNGLAEQQQQAQQQQQQQRRTSQPTLDVFANWK